MTPNNKKEQLLKAINKASFRWKSAFNSGDAFSINTLRKMCFLPFIKRVMRKIRIHGHDR